MYFLITWTTYGYWLPGDPRGFRTRRAKEYVHPPERYSDGATYEPEKYKRLYERCLSETHKPVCLNKNLAGKNNLEAPRASVGRNTSGNVRRAND